MKILHAPFNIGGMASSLAKAQRTLGYNAKSLVFLNSHFQFPVDFDLSSRKRWLDRCWFRMRLALEYRIFQFYYGSSVLGSTLWEIPLLRRIGKKLFFYFCGCDLRNPDITIARYSVSACAACKPRQCNSSYNNTSRAVALEYGKMNFVSTPDLLEFLPGSVLLPQAVDFDLIDKLKQSPPAATDRNRFRIAHAPTNRTLKGTSYLLKAVEDLKKEGLAIDLVLIENVPHDEALCLYRGADVAVDQLLVGSYGLLAAELMGLGVPTLCYLRQDLIKSYPEEPPLLNVNPGNIKEKLLYCYQFKDRLQSIADSGRAYARKYHHPLVLAKTCLNYYLN